MPLGGVQIISGGGGGGAQPPRTPPENPCLIYSLLVCLVNRLSGNAP